MQLRLRSRFLHRLMLRLVNWLLAFSLDEKVSRVEASLDSFPARLIKAERLYALYYTLHASDTLWSRISQEIRLDIRRAHSLYGEALDLYEEYQSFVGPRLFFPRLEAMEELLTRLRSAHTELTVTIEQLNTSK
jgi:hypothetical protein